jgi:hypothetical protein
MTIKVTSDHANIEISICDYSNLYELANAFRAIAFALGYTIENINEAIPSDHECR